MESQQTAEMRLGRGWLLLCCLQILHNPLLDLLTGLGFLTTLQSARSSAASVHGPAAGSDFGAGRTMVGEHPMLHLCVALPLNNKEEHHEASGFLGMHL